MGWLVAVAAIVIGLPVAAGWLLQDRLVFFPQPAGASVARDRVEPLEIVASDGTRLRGWIRAAATLPAPTVLYFGGNAEEVSWILAEPRWPERFNIAAVNYRGYGQSEGRPGEKAIVGDALAIHDAIAQRSEVDHGRIVALGRSLGTGVAVQLAAARPLAAVVLASPYDSLVALGRRHYPVLPVQWLLRHRFDSLVLASRLRAPLLALVAEHDPIVPASHSRTLFDAWAGEKRWVVVRDTDHNTLSVPDAFWRAIERFLDKHVP